MTSTGWLAHCDPALKAAVLRQAIWRTAEPGDAISYVGDEIGGIFGIVEGVAGISVPERPECSVIHLLQPGDWHGFHIVVTGKPRITSTFARSKCVYALIPQAGVQRMLKTNPEWWRDFAILCEGTLILALRCATDLMMPDSERRTAAVLLRLAGRWPGRVATTCETVLPITQDELAAIAALSRNTLSKIIGHFRDQGLIDVGYRKIVLHDVARLHAIANPESA